MEVKLEYDIVIIGAGICGLMVAHRLKERGIENYLLIDKGRSVGGRLATRRIGKGVFDHGAQFFSARSCECKLLFEQWQANQLIQRGSDSQSGVARFHATRGMNSLAKHLAKEQPAITQMKVNSVNRTGELWSIHCNNIESQESFQTYAHKLIVTVPVPQAISLFANSQSPHNSILDPICLNQLHQVSYDPCIALLVNLKSQKPLFEQEYLENVSDKIAWIADNQHKGISPIRSITIHATGNWSEKHYNEDEKEIEQQLLEAVQPWIDIDEVDHIQVKRWKYAKAKTLYQAPYLEAFQGTCIFAGDGFSNDRKEQTGKVETSIISGICAADYLASLT